VAASITARSNASSVEILFIFFPPDNFLPTGISPAATLLLSYSPAAFFVTCLTAFLLAVLVGEKNSRGAGIPGSLAKI